MKDEAVLPKRVQRLLWRYLWSAQQRASDDVTVPVPSKSEIHMGDDDVTSRYNSTKT